jgi:two-component system, NarL family, invasion response regulator UvrY
VIRILVADDHFIVRAGLQKIIADIADMVCVDEATDGHQAIEKASRGDLDVVLLDISMPGPDWVDVLKSIKQEHPNLAVLILSVHPEKQYAVRAIKSGASGYLTKDKAHDELIKAIRKAAAGSRYISTGLAEQLADLLELKEDRLPHESLSNREFSVMVMLAKGSSLSAIARSLCVSPKTVSTYRARILEKMKMNGNAQIIHYAIKHGLIETE